MMASVTRKGHSGGTGRGLQDRCPWMDSRQAEAGRRVFLAWAQLCRDTWLESDTGVDRPVLWLEFTAPSREAGQELRVGRVLAKGAERSKGPSRTWSV